jgi:hypothetical protein
MSARECREFDKALSRGDQAVEALEIHSETCADCRERLRLWREISEAAPGLAKSWDSPHLFPGIARALAAAKLTSRAPATPAADSPARRRFVWVPAAVAASLFVLSMVGLYVFKPGESARDPFARPSMGREPLMSNQTLKEVEDAESNYLTSIEKLSRLAEPRMANPDSPLLVSYREKLQLLDSAIGDLRGQLEGNRFNTHLRKELLAMYQEKKHTLEEVLKEVKS